MALVRSPESFFPQMNSTSLFLWFQLVTTGVGASFDPTSIIGTNLVEVHEEMLKTKYQSSTPSSFRGKEFHVNKIDLGLRVDVTYRKSKPYPFKFQRRRILNLVFFVPMFQLVTPGLGSVLTPKI